MGGWGQLGDVGGRHGLGFGHDLFEYWQLAVGPGDGGGNLWVLVGTLVWVLVMISEYWQLDVGLGFGWGQLGGAG